MAIEKLFYQKTVCVGQFLFDKIGGEATIDPGQTPDEVLSNLNKTVTDWHRKEYPHLYQEPPAWANTPVAAPRQKIELLPTISKDKERIEIAIDNAETIADLQYLRSDSFENGLGAHYVQRFNELNNGSPTNFTDGLE